MGSVKLLKASAGSGKTYRLAYEYIRIVIDDPWQYRHILAVTFTNKATEEMKRRIVAEINELAVGHETDYLALLIKDLGLTAAEIKSRARTARTRILHDYSHFSVLTIDKFFQRLIRSFIKELGIDLNFNLELQTGTLLSTAADNLLDEISLNEPLKKWMTGFVEERIEENRRWEIKSELIRLGHQVFREEYHRSGAVRVSRDELEKIVSEASFKASEIINLLRSTAKQALEIIADNDLTISDFPYKDKGFANFFVKYANGDIAEPGSRVMEALESDDKWYGKSSARRADIEAVIPAIRPLLEQLAEGYDRHHRFLNSVELLRANYRNFALLTNLLQKIEEICAAENILPISETNNILNKLILGNDTPFIFEKAGNHFNYFMIDEFQDTSSMQWENFIPLLKNAVSQHEASPVLLVGDVKQSIYRWRGGDWRILAGGIGNKFDETETLDLNTNYRSFSNIVAFNNEIVESCIVADNDRLNFELDAAMENGLIGNDLQSQLSDMLCDAYKNHAQKSVKGNGKGYINITVYEKEDGDASTAIPPIISRIEELQSRGYSAGDIAVLVRTGADGVRIADMLLAHKQANPNSPYSYDVVTQEALLINSSSAVSFVLACFRLSVSSVSALQRVVYNRFSGRPFESDIPGDELDFLTRLRLMPPEEAFEAVVMRFGLNKCQNDVAYLQAFHEQLLAFTRNSVSDIQLFIDWWDENGGNVSVNIPKSDSAITISTIHKSKGLEYKVVIIPYCNWELNPRGRTIVWADGGLIADGLGAIPVGFNEKMRNSLIASDYYRELVMSHIDNMNIFYVAVTRAEEELHIMMPADAKPRNDKINTLILNSLSVDNDRVGIGRMEGVVAQEKGNMVYEFGERISVETVSHKSQKFYSAFGSYPIADRLVLKMDSMRYYPDGQNDAILSPRDYGILMHRVFEAATGSDDINRTIVDMTASGLLTADEAQQLENKVKQAFKNPFVRSWFDGSWDVVRNENDIIMPGGAKTRRPDRVMTKNGHAVIVDYKFGLNRSAANARQIREYADALRLMGYHDISGFIWYVSLDDIEQIL